MAEKLGGAPENQSSSTRSNLASLKSEVGEVDLGVKLGIGKIKNKKAGGVLMGEKGFVLVDSENNIKFEPFPNNMGQLGNVKEVFSDGRVIFDKGIGIINQKTGQITPLFFEAYGVDNILDFREDGVIIFENRILYLDIQKKSLEFDSGKIHVGEIIKVEKTDIFIRVLGDKGAFISPLGGKNAINIGPDVSQIVIAQEINYEQLEIGNFLSISKSIFREDEGLLIRGSDKIVKLNGSLFQEYIIPADLGIGFVKGISSSGFILGKDGIARLNKDGSLQYKITAAELGMVKINTIGANGNIIGIDTRGKGQVVKVNIETGKIIETSSNLSDEIVKELNNLGIYDLDRFGSEAFVKHIIKNRQNIESLGEKGVVLIVHPKSDHNQAFSTDNMEMLRYTNDTLYYEVGSEQELIGIFEDLMKRLPKDVHINHFILGGHGNQHSIQLSRNFNDIDGSSLNTNDGEKLEKYADLFKNTQSIVLKSCSTGKGGLQENNMLSMIANGIGKYVTEIVAPEVDTNSEYAFNYADNGRRVNNKEWFFSGVKFYTNNVVKVRGAMSTGRKSSIMD